MVDIENRLILVTGGRGFLGKAVCKELEARGADVVATGREHNLLKQSRAAYLMSRQPEVVIHLAATVGGIGANQENPGRFFYENMMMGMNVIEAARIHAPHTKVVLVGTTCSYPKYTPVPFKESDLWNGYPEETNAPYGVAKRALITMGQAYRKQYGMNIVSLLPANLYGPGDNFDPKSSHVIPALIRKFVAAKEYGAPSVELWGTGSASREFLYVDEAARGIISALQFYDGEEPINLASGEEITIHQLAEKIKTMVGYEGEVVWNTSYPDGQPRRCLDIGEAIAKFGFLNSVGFNNGLKATIEWYLRNR